jgi:hypothetical protein
MSGDVMSFDDIISKKEPKKGDVNISNWRSCGNCRRYAPYPEIVDKHSGYCHIVDATVSNTDGCIDHKYERWYPTT